MERLFSVPFGKIYKGGKTGNGIIYLFYVLVGLITALIVYNLFFYQDYVDKNVTKYSLQNHGFQVYKDVLDIPDIQTIKMDCDKKEYKKTKQFLREHPKLRKLIEQQLGDEYVFQDYIWIIKKSVVHTCHRDNNGDFFNKNQKHPSYTMLIYVEDMEKCLGVIPQSHRHLSSFAMNITDPTINLPCSKGDVIIFNANLIHVGSMNKNDNNLRMQMKVTHRDDVKHIQYYENFNKIMDTTNTLPTCMRRAQKRLSCMFPMISNLTQNENIRTARGSSDGVDVGIRQKAFSYLFYGDSKFYDLPNAF